MNPGAGGIAPSNRWLVVVLVAVVTGLGVAKLIESPAPEPPRVPPPVPAGGTTGPMAASPPATPAAVGALPAPAVAVAPPAPAVPSGTVPSVPRPVEGALADEANRLFR